MKLVMVKWSAFVTMVLDRGSMEKFLTAKFISLHHEVQ